LSRASVFREVLLAEGLRARRAVGGSRVGLMMPPSVDNIAALLAIWSAGAIVVPICLTHPLPEITHTVKDSDQDFIMYHASFQSRLETLLKDRCGINLSNISAQAKPKQVRRLWLVTYPSIC
jgi:malonyl-CoA/methylmalonyl-CoA synthetase